MNDERDSQLSAMFDNQLPESECELLARRLSRDEALQRQWAGFALIGAAIRGEPVRARTLAAVVRDGEGVVAERVRLSLTDAASHMDSPAQTLTTGAGGLRLRESTAAWLRPIAGFGIAAGVAALSVFWLRQSALDTTTARISDAAAHGRTTIVLPGSGARLSAGQSPLITPANPRVRGTEPESYTVPVPRAGTAGIASAQLANYVVAHSEFSGPLARRNLLSALVASGSVPEAAAPDAAAAVKPVVGQR